MAIFFPSLATAYTVSLQGDMAAASDLIVSAGGNGILLTKQLHGGLVTAKWYGLVAAATLEITVFVANSRSDGDE